MNCPYRCGAAAGAGWAAPRSAQATDRPSTSREIANAAAARFSRGVKISTRRLSTSRQAYWGAAVSGCPAARLMS